MQVQIDGFIGPEQFPIRPLATEIKRSIISGPEPVMRDWRRAMYQGQELSRAEKVMAFAEAYLVVPDGIKRGQPLHLEDFQEAFIYAVFDNHVPTTTAILSVARRNGKTFIIAIIILAFLVGPLAVRNSSIASAANSREQAALIFKMMERMIKFNPDLTAVTKIVPSSKHITGLAKNTEYFAMSAEAKTGHGQSLMLIVLDESGQIVGPSNDYISMLETSQGSYEEPLFITISTQAPSDGDYLSIQIDDAEKSRPEETVAHVYRAPKDAELMQREYWKFANPGIGIFRSEKDVEKQMQRAVRLPEKENSVRNLLLNQRVSREMLWLSPNVWKKCNGPIDIKVFLNNPVSIGIDLSRRNDLTAAVLAAQDYNTGIVHVLPYVFCPSKGLRARVKRDRAPYDTWVDNGQMFTIEGPTIDYEIFAERVRDAVEDDLGIVITTIEFDRWRINEFQKAAERQNFASWAEWNEVGQGYKDFSPRCEAMQSLLLAGRIRHGGHPLLNLAASNAIAVKDPSGNTKLDKSKSTQRIDPLVAMVMAVFPVSEGDTGEGFDADGMIG